MGACIVSPIYEIHNLILDSYICTLNAGGKQKSAEKKIIRTLNTYIEKSNLPMY